MSSSDIRLVVFDLGGVIVRVASWDEAHRLAGLAAADYPGDAFTAEVLSLARLLDGGMIEPETSSSRGPPQLPVSTASSSCERCTMPS